MITIALSMAVVIAGCGSPPDPTAQLDTIHSWTATARLTRQEFRAGALPVKFTTGVAEEARRALGESRETMERSRLSPPQSDSTRAAADSLALAIRQLNVDLQLR